LQEESKLALEDVAVTVRGRVDGRELAGAASVGRELGLELFEVGAVNVAGSLLQTFGDVPAWRLAPVS
jgi:hypothetical protein